MIAADHDGGIDLAFLHHFIERQSQAMALAEADPADARRQSLEGDALLGHIEPIVQMWIVGNELLHALVGLVDVFRVAGEGGPAERTYAAAEQRADIGRHEAWKSKGVLEPHVESDLADIVAVIEGRH